MFFGVHDLDNNRKILGKAENVCRVQHAGVQNCPKPPLFPDAEALAASYL